jgi:NAD-dependent aldehyde dehydrogenases
MNVPVNSRSIDIPTEFQSCFDKQRAAYLAAPEPSYAQRIADLKSLTRLLKDNKDELVAAINADYGNRSEFEPCSPNISLSWRPSPTQSNI